MYSGHWSCLRSLYKRNFSNKTEVIEMEQIQTTKQIAREMMDEIQKYASTPDDANERAVTFLLSALLKHQKDLRNLEAQYESLSYKLLQEQEKRRYEASN
jgi:hypothetical protein